MNLFLLLPLHKLLFLLLLLPRPRLLLWPRLIVPRVSIWNHVSNALPLLPAPFVRVALSVRSLFLSVIFASSTASAAVAPTGRTPHVELKSCQCHPLLFFRSHIDCVWTSTWLHLSFIFFSKFPLSILSFFSILFSLLSSCLFCLCPLIHLSVLSWRMWERLGSLRSHQGCPSSFRLRSFSQSSQPVHIRDHFTSWACDFGGGSTNRIKPCALWQIQTNDRLAGISLLSLLVPFFFPSSSLLFCSFFQFKEANTEVTVTQGAWTQCSRKEQLFFCS